MQGKLKREAGESAVAEQASAVEAVRAENAAALAKLAENEARARALRDNIRDLRTAHDAQVSTNLAGQSVCPLISDSWVVSTRKASDFVLDAASKDCAIRPPAVLMWLRACALLTVLLELSNACHWCM